MIFSRYRRQSSTNLKSTLLTCRALGVVLAATLFALPGCEKGGEQTQDDTASAPSADMKQNVTPTSQPDADAEREVAKAPDPTERPAPRKTASPKPDIKTPRPTAAARASNVSPTLLAAPITSAEQEQLVKLCSDSGLTEPPNLRQYPPDVAQHLKSTIERAAAEQTADAIGYLGCLYFDIMVSREDTDRAVDCFERARELDPKSYVWPHLLGRIFIRRASYVRARIEFEKSMELNPDYPDNYAWAADVAWRGEDDEAAAELYKKFIEKAPNEPVGYAGMASYELKKGNNEEALEYLEKGLAIDPGDRRIHMGLSQYHYAMGNNYRAARHKGFAENMNYSHVTRNDPINLVLLGAAGPTSIAVSRIQALATTGSREVADNLRDKLLAEYPSNALLLTGVAETSLLIGRIDEAVDYVQKALAVEPAYVRALVDLADCRLAQGDAEAALESVDRALALDSEYPSAHIAKARALRMLERNDEALSAFMKAIELQPDNIQLKTQAGEIMRGLGQLEEAKEWCSKLVRGAEADGEVTAVYAPAYMTLANIAHAQDNADFAVESLKRAVMTDPTREPIFRQLAGLLIELGKGDEALALGQRLMIKQPHLLEYAVTYGNLLAATGRRDKGIQHLDQLTEEVPHHPAPRMALATIYLEQDDLDKAEVQLNKVIELQEGHEGAHLLLIDIARRRNDADAAFASVQLAYEKNPKSVLIVNSFAWMLATTPAENHRDSKRAIELAEEAVSRTGRKVSNYLDTLACAYAAAGRFDDAIKTLEEAIEIAKKFEQLNLKVEYEGRLDLFKNNKPYVESRN